MTPIDYKKVFSQLSHIKALSHDNKFDQIVQNIITYALNHTETENPKTDKDVAKKIMDVFGISIRPGIITSNLDKLLSSKEIIKDPLTKQLALSPNIANKINQRLTEANQLEQDVKNKWFEEIIINTPEISEDTLMKLWDALKLYLCEIFEKHGVQTLHLLNPSFKINQDDQISFTHILDKTIKQTGNIFSKETLSKAINFFINNADETRTNYISQLADATFTSFALTSDAETVSFLNQRYNNLHLFLDTNFIFGILDLHKNNEDSSAREILEEAKKNKLPFILCYHPETLLEFKRTFDSKALALRASKWSRESSRVALAVDGLSPLEELFHKQNAEDEIDSAVFLEKYDHVDLILRDLGFKEYAPKHVSDLELGDLESDVEKYTEFYETNPHRKQKYYLGFKHDIVVLREVRRLNPKKTKFLESNAFFISSDYVLAKFEKKYYKKNYEINYVVSPSVFLQLIRPFIEVDHESNKRFIDTFSIPEVRAFEIDYSTTRSKALQILNDNYHDTSFETKVNILRDSVLMDKLDKLSEDDVKQQTLIESRIALENKILSEQKNKAEEATKKIKEEYDLLISSRKEIETAVEKTEKEKETISLEKSKIIAEKTEKESEIIILQAKLESVNAALEKEKLNTKFQQDLNSWEEYKITFIKGELDDKRTNYLKASKLCVKPILLAATILIVLPLLVKFYEEVASFFHVPIWIIFSVILVLLCIAVYEYFFRNFLADKEKIKLGLLWIGTFGVESKKKMVLNRHVDELEKEYIARFKKPSM